jgi:repressor LexA
MTSRTNMGKTDATIVACIAEYTAEHGFSPTIRELQELLGYRSTSSIHFHIRKLSDAGILRYEPCKPRTLVIL